MSHVDFKKKPCRPVVFKGQWPCLCDFILPNTTCLRQSYVPCHYISTPDISCHYIISPVLHVKFKKCLSYVSFGSGAMTKKVVFI